MGREGVSRGTTQIHRASDALCANIHWLPNNAGITFQTTDVQTCNVLTRKAQEGTSTGFCRAQLSANLLRISGGFCQSTFLCHSLCLINVIICKNEEMSRLDINSHLVAASGFIAKQSPNDWGLLRGRTPRNDMHGQAWKMLATGKQAEGSH